MEHGMGTSQSFSADTSLCRCGHSEDLIISLFITIQKLSHEGFFFNYNEMISCICIISSIIFFSSYFVPNC